ncbi:DUF1338 domain-containing protein [Catenovulum maritimum]|uniref:2-oxoadipate dioxygenase/decarboxylase n=1 Tax=Catenovulum maritimum TaxID=1513271 RepID=A0A0J8GSF9_9ALTE|nr:DUF1338 domain-containing protein [Catenovulum maritimum]KMT65735.1 hypothetical protein XM47_06900 [Catenovulum maritimum]
MKQVDNFFHHLWLDYIKLTPSAIKLQALLQPYGEIVNDHIALRTFNLAPINLASLVQLLEPLGYTVQDTYHFKEKKLNACYLSLAENPYPKIFISELNVAGFSHHFQTIIRKLVEQNLASNRVLNLSFFYSGRHWQLPSTDYYTLLEESEYAAWLAALGFHANHFTVSVNHLADLNLEQVNQVIKQAGFKLNQSGGEIKGDSQSGLKQSATLADMQIVDFIDTQLELPSCFYEFAERYSLVSNYEHSNKDAFSNLYQGFVPSSADKIFHSTDMKL